MKRLRVPLFTCILAAVAVTAVGALSVPAASAASQFFKKGGEPTCTVTNTSSLSSSTTCTGTLSNKSSGLMAVTDVSGFAVFQCQNLDGTATTGQNQVRAETQSSTPIPTGGNVMFTTNPAVLTAPSTVSAQDAGCTTGSTAINPTLTTTNITLSIVGGTIGPTCTTSDPNGLSGTVLLTC